MYIRHCVKLVNLADKLGLGDLLGEVYVKRLNPNFSTSLSLHAHIALRVFSATHYYYCQSRHLTKSRAKNINNCHSHKSQRQGWNFSLINQLIGGVSTLPYFSERRRTSSAISDRMV